MLGTGIEPAFLSEPEPKSGASANSATRAGAAIVPFSSAWFYLSDQMLESPQNFLKQAIIGRRESILGKFIGSDPAYFARRDGPRISCLVPADERENPHRCMSIGVIDGRPGFENFNLNAGFFAHLADQAVLGCFTWVAFATGKFPIATQRLFVRALADQNAFTLGIKDHRDGNTHEIDGRALGHRSLSSTRGPLCQRCLLALEYWFISWPIVSWI